MNLSRACFCLGVILTPIYLFPSGGLQLSDVFFITSFLVFLTKDSYLLFDELRVFSGLIFLRIFVFWAFLVNFCVFFVYFQNDTLKSSVYYFYCYMVMVLALAHIRMGGIPFLTKIFYSFVVSAILVLFFAIFNLDYLFSDKYFYRRAVTFNNPNQLGYWALMTSAILLILKSILSPKKPKYFNLILFLCILVTIYLCLLSLSKAAMISMAMLLVLNSIKNLRLVLLIILVGFVASLYVELEDNDVISKVGKRVVNIGAADDDNLEARNYDRILKYPEYLILGAGEGTIRQRFDKDNEIHSTVGTVIFSYGLIGTFLAGSFLLKFLRSHKISFLTFQVPLLLYGITHMGLRSKLCWMIVILVIVSEHKMRKKSSG